MNCDKCNSDRILEFSAKCSDCFMADYKHYNGPYDGYDGYVPSNIGIGGNDYVKICLCLECGKVQGEFPIPESKVIKALGKEIEK